MKPSSKRIVCNLDTLLKSRNLSLTELSERVGITYANLSVLKNNHAKAIRFSTLTALCEALNCEIGELFVYTESVAATEIQKSSSIELASQNIKSTTSIFGLQA